MSRSSPSLNDQRAVPVPAKQPGDKTQAHELSTDPPIVIGESAVMKRLFAIIARIAPTDSSVLITGNTGTGKELVARTIHAQSGRRNAAFVDINCSAIPDTLFEAELFGHQRGTFTGAHADRRGLFEVASEGTLFLDEVQALSLNAQAKLLRVLQEHSVRRVGGRSNIAVNMRVISATNADLAEAVLAGRFRPDLYYRLRVLPLLIPDLSEREGDVVRLVEYFLARHGMSSHRFTAEAMQAMNDYTWPGNVRELENAMEYVLAIAAHEQLTREDLPPDIAKSTPRPQVNNLLNECLERSASLAEVEQRYVMAMLDKYQHPTQAAAALGIDRRTLYRKMRQYRTGKSW